jgi:hypothetical protein
MRNSALAIGLICILVRGFSAQAAVTITPIGNPSFIPTDFHLFSAPLGTAADGYAEFGTTQRALLPPPNHLPNDILGIGPGMPHPGPYNMEFANGVAANGFVDANEFTTDQYANGSGVLLVFILVPSTRSPTGSSPDFTSGPILQNDIFPLTVDGGTFTNGILNDSLGQFRVPAINLVLSFEELEGHSHIPFFFVDNYDFASSPITGNYEYRISILDSDGNGYEIDAPFQVVTEPSALAMSLVGTSLIGLARHRRQVRSRKFI